MLKPTVTVEAAVLVGIKPELMIEFWGIYFPHGSGASCLTFRNVLNEQLFTGKVNANIRLCSFLHRGCLRSVQNRGVIAGDCWREELPDVVTALEEQLSFSSLC